MATGSPLIAAVTALCARLAPLGWKQIFEQHGLDITAANLAAELARPLPDVDRSRPGFTDFAASATRGIEPARPSHSLLFHGLSTPLDRDLTGDRTPVTGYPTQAELMSLLDYVFAVEPPSVEDLRAKAGGAPLAVVVFAFEYRAAVDTVHRKHADLCFSRIGIARAGTRPAKYDESLGAYATDQGDGREVGVLPCRYGAFIATAVTGSAGGHGPMDFVERDQRASAVPPPEVLPSSVQKRLSYGTQVGDADRRFWIPLHKLFSGTECIDGFEFDVQLHAHHVNEKIRRTHLFFGAAGHDGGWREPDISRSPFTFTDGIAEFGDASDVGAGLLVPVPHTRLVDPAEYSSAALWYNVPKTDEDTPWGLKASSLNLKALLNGGRAAPEYIHARHVIPEVGRERNLNDFPDVGTRVAAGGYRARHYIDYTGDGWIDVEIPELGVEIPVSKAAYSLVGPPDFFPLIRQSELTRWTDQAASPELQSRIWPPNPGRPEPLSAHRLAANLSLKGAHFDQSDDTMTAIVGLFGSGEGAQSPLAVPNPPRASTLPDGAAGVFGPGWEAALDRTPESEADSEERKWDPGVTFLTNYGLGSPFPEDSMLCSAYSSYWPAVVPDITRTFPPNLKYATATPLLDSTIGMDGETPWDGIAPPTVRRNRGVPKSVDYLSIDYGDYVETTLDKRFDFAAVTGTTVADYLARTVTMASVYRALGLKELSARTQWSVLSFTRARPSEPALTAELERSNIAFEWQWAYRFELIRHGGQQSPSKRHFNRIKVPVLDHAVFAADPNVVLRLQDGAWKICDPRN